MTQSNITFIDQLDVSKSQFTMKVRIIYLMKHLAYGSSTKTYKIDMILIDEHERRSRQRLLTDRLKHLKDCFMRMVITTSKIHNLVLIKKNSFVDNENKINIYTTTKVTPCNERTGSLYGFSFANFNTILDGSFVENTLVDVVRCFSMEILMNKKNKLSKRVNLSLKNLNGKQINVTL
uniref:Uncharacterized protein n=1 Tax=Lactuca sativa TaxID=4236 RepID=A0A9R1XC98_LACSA|nr:hypothetical protein LSAT_V11C500293340 [Lactuca sativa]